MSVVGSLIFCEKCGNLMDAIQKHIERLVCDLCHADYDARRFDDLRVITESSEHAFPSTLRSKRSAVKTSLGRDEMDEGATIKEKCPECGHDEMQFHTLQLRSADEGSTVFYTCKKCGYRFRQAN